MSYIGFAVFNNCPLCHCLQPSLFYVPCHFANKKKCVHVSKPRFLIKVFPETLQLGRTFRLWSYFMLLFPKASPLNSVRLFSASMQIVTLSLQQALFPPTPQVFIILKMSFVCAYVCVYVCVLAGYNILGTQL